MCYINGCRVSKEEYIRYKQILKELKNLQLTIPVQRGFDYRDWPIIIPIENATDISIEFAHWELIPPSIHNADDLIQARKSGYPWLNAKHENLFKNEKGQKSMWANAAKNGRCLVLSSGFYEHRHIPKYGKKGQELKETEKIPYYISVANEHSYFFMAGIYQVWTNYDMNQSAKTFAIVTTEANDLMQQVHNSKKRMPTILTQELAEEWLQPDLSEKRILEIGKTQYDSENMFAYPVAKNFLTSDEPEKEFDYADLPPIL